MSRRAAILVVAIGLLPTAGWAQESAITTAPPNLVISNYNSTSVGFSRKTGEARCLHRR